MGQGLEAGRPCLSNKGSGVPPWCPLHPPGLDGRINRDSP